MARRVIDKQTGEELFQSGETVTASGEYELIDEQGNKTDYDIITLDEGEQFPEIKERNLYFRMVATCLEEKCE